MDIKIGKQYVNKTWRFLVPCLRGHGTTFVNKFNPLFKLAVGIHDTYLDGSTISNGRNIYILIDKKYKPNEYEKFMDYIKYQDYFKGEYCPDSEVVSSRKHIVIIEVPKQFNNAYDNFLQGKYSKMYSDDELKILYASILAKKSLTDDQKAKMRDYEILSKTGTDGLNTFLKSVNEEFDVIVNPSDFTTPETEWELPLKKKEEIFNYPNGKGVFFNEKLDKVWQ
jgi:hypothetical protein